MTRLAPRAALALAALVALAAPAPAQQGADRSSAQATFRTFQRAIRQAEMDDPESMARAISCLDLSELDVQGREELARRRALDLAQLLSQVTIIPDDLIPDAPGADPFVLYRDPDGHGAIELDRVEGEWLFTADTVAAVPALLEATRRRDSAQEATELGQDPPPGAAAAPPPPPPAEEELAPEYEHGYDWLRAHLPESLKQRVLLLEYWQWLGLVLLCVLGVALDYAVIALLVVIVQQLLARQGMDAERELIRKSVRPFGLLAMAAFWWLGLGWLGLHAEALRVVATGVKAVALVAGVWGSYRLVDVVCNALERKALRSVSKYDDLLVPLVRKTLKVAVFVVGFVVVANIFEFDVSGILAGLGLGGLAFALAAQDTVKNVFGSLTVVLDRPFEVGDWVKIDDVEGCVEEVGFRSTRVRTFYSSLISLPNAKLLTATVDNMGRRQYRRFTTTLGVTYDTPPDKLEALCEGIRELIRQHPYTRKDYFQVWVSGLADCSIDVLLYLFWECPDWTGELRSRQEFILDVLRLCERLGVEIAFPTQTLHVAAGEAPADERAQAPDALQTGRNAALAVAEASRARLKATARPTTRLAVGPSEADLAADSGEDSGMSGAE